MSLDKNIQVFLELVRAGLWEKEAYLSKYGEIDYNEVMRLAEMQSLDGLVTAGIEHAQDVKAPQDVVLQFVGNSLQLEQRNLAMNKFVAKLIDNLRKENLYAVLVKGQGLAQCYERPHWRASGDIDLLLSDSNHRKAITYIIPLSSSHKNGGDYSKEYAVTIDDWMIELHGSLRTGLSGRVDRMVDEVQQDVFYEGNVRSWDNNGTTVFLPSPNNDVFFVFTHFIKHFYKEGMNLRQICDWCRLLWTYKEPLNHELLEKRIRKAGLMSEWKAFAALAVKYLGMPEEAMPFYDVRGKKKAERVLKHILKGESYNLIRDTWTIGKIFPWNTIKFVPAIFFNVNGLKIKERVFG